MVDSVSSGNSNGVMPKILVLGVGNAGVNAINHMIISQLDLVRFASANTDCQTLMSSLADTKIQLGIQCTKGLGAGTFPEVGRKAAEEATDILKREMADIDMLILASGMGGGTGTGASPVIAKIAKDMGILTLAIIVKPFVYEGIKRMKIAEEGVNELEKLVDTMIVIENEKISSVNNSGSIFNDYAITDSIFKQAVYCIVDILTKKGYINRDFADIRTILSNGGRGIIGYGEDIDPKIAVDTAVHNPVLEIESIKGAKNILVNITGGKNLKRSDIQDVIEKITMEAKINEEIPNIIPGVCYDESIGDNIRVSVVATGVQKIVDNVIDNRDESFEITNRKANNVIKNDFSCINNKISNIDFNAKGTNIEGDNFNYKNFSNIEDNVNIDNKCKLENINEIDDFNIKNYNYDMEQKIDSNEEIHITNAPVFNKPIDEDDFEIENEPLKTDDIPYIDNDTMDVFKNDFLSKKQEKKKMTFDSNNQFDNVAEVSHNKTLLGDDYDKDNYNEKQKSNSVIEFVSKKPKKATNCKQIDQSNDIQSGLFDINNKQKKKGLLSKIADVFGTTSFMSTNEVKDVFTDDLSDKEDDIYTTPAIKRKISNR